MIVKDILFGAFGENVLEAHEKVEIEHIKKGYDLWRVNEERLKWELWDILQKSNSFETYKDRVKEHLGKKYGIKWRREENKIVLDYESWEWLLSINHKHIDFKECDLKNFNRDNGLIGSFNGIDLFVKEYYNIN